MCSGLRTLGVVQFMRAFPDLPAPMLTYTACVTAEGVTDALSTDSMESVIATKTILKKFFAVDDYLKPHMCQSHHFH